MAASADLPKFAWRRRLDQILELPGKPNRPPWYETFDLIPLSLRLSGFLNRERTLGREVAADFLTPLNPSPIGGVPLGGLGGGSIMRGWQGDFSRWSLQPGKIDYQMVAADQFSVFVQRGSEPPRLRVLSSRQPEQGELRGWGWGLDPARATYYGLYPRAWTEYTDPDPKLRLTCRQISPVIPHNYEESSTPAAAFEWTIENTGKEAATVGILFTFQNGDGGENDRAGGHSNYLFRERNKGGEVVGVELRHTHRQQVQGGSHVYEDPLTFAIAARSVPGVEVTYRTRFMANSSGMDVWGDFRNNGSLENLEDDTPSKVGSTIGAAVCATVRVPPGQTREVAFSLAWDMPLARMGEGGAYYRRYTRFYGREGDAASKIARDALLNYPDWEKRIEAWQKPILAETGLPDWFKSALFNELYYLTGGGTIWTDGEEGKKPPKAGDIGHFGYLEGHDYRYLNTYDVHFYASFALAMLWPQLQLSLQRDFAQAIDIEHPEMVTMLGTNKKSPRKVRGAVPHDLGAPVEDPWRKVNAYNIQDTSRWKDLNAKFALSVYRDVVATGDDQFAAEMWGPVTEAISYLAESDLDDDGLIENEGLPDQTFDTWLMEGPSAYCGGLWLGALSAAGALAVRLGKKADAKRYASWLERAQQSFEDLLWNGDYYNYDSSRNRQRNSIMAAQLTGYWYSRACGLPSVVPEANARRALETIFAYNVENFEDGAMGAVNGMRPDGRVDGTSLQSQEVWTGVTYSVAAAMLQEEMHTEAWATAKGIYQMGWDELGYWYMTPEAWNWEGNFRALGYMRPLAIWAMLWAWQGGPVKKVKKAKKK